MYSLKNAPWVLGGGGKVLARDEGRLVLMPGTGAISSLEVSEGGATQQN